MKLQLKVKHITQKATLTLLSSKEVRLSMQTVSVKKAFLCVGWSSAGAAGKENSAHQFNIHKDLFVKQGSG